MMDFFVPILLVVGAGVLLLWGLFPLANWYRFSVPVHPAARILGDFSAYGWLEEFFDGTARKLETLGLRHVDDCAADEVVPGVRFVGRMMVDEQRRFAGFIVAIDLQRGNVWIEQSRAVIFSSKLADGSILGSRNEFTLSAFPEPSSVSLLLYHPRVDLEKMRDNHLLVAGAMAGSSAIVDPLQGCAAGVGCAAQILAADFQRQFQYAFQQGYLQKSPEGQSREDVSNPYQPIADGPPSYTMTFTGAFKMTWCQLFPLRQIRLFRARLRGRRLLQNAAKSIKQSV